MDKEFVVISPDSLRYLISEAVASTVRDELNLHFRKKTDKQIYTRKEVAQELGISLVTLGEWTKRGIIKAFRIGNSVRYKAEDVDKALKEVHSLKYMRSRTINNVQL